MSMSGAMFVRKNIGNCSCCSWLIEKDLWRAVFFCNDTICGVQEIFPTPNFPKQIFRSKFSNTKFADKQIFRNHIWCREICFGKFGVGKIVGKISG